ncbi:hypothetical protein ONZ45_g8147 [Pleurotus djamor]|nr:hypothetical protein ONZ45_g15715 [Pleurotus djamor]KAJ8514304.1 hypothetical protein ONZ45_g8147 [Pleurotus djamor]
MSNITNYVTKNKSPSQRASDRWVYQGTYTDPTTHEKLNVSVIAYLFTSSDELEDDEDVQFHLTVRGLIRILPEVLLTIPRLLEKPTRR